MYKRIGVISEEEASFLLEAAELSSWKINKGPDVDYATAPFFTDKFIKIPAGGWIKRHSDNGGKPEGTKTIHVVLSTNDKCINISYAEETQEIHMPKNSIWEFDTWPEHESLNNGDTDRIHLVMDI